LPPREAFELLTDVLLPQMNGRDLVKRLTAICPRLRSLFMSGYTAAVLGEQGSGGEGMNFLHKPFPGTSWPRKCERHWTRKPAN
jgi:FixJ family two-component response regulator